MKTILFICTGNTCRSPMAAALMNRLLSGLSAADVKAESAGLAANEGEPASRNAVEAMRELGISLEAHKARRLTREMAQGSDEIFTMSPSHAAMLKAAYPACAAKVHVLGNGIPDPYGGNLSAYRACRDSILAALKIIVTDFYTSERDG